MGNMLYAPNLVSVTERPYVSGAWGLRVVTTEHRLTSLRDLSVVEEIVPASLPDFHDSSATCEFLRRVEELILVLDGLASTYPFLHTMCEETGFLQAGDRDHAWGTHQGMVIFARRVSRLGALLNKAGDMLLALKAQLKATDAGCLTWKTLKKNLKDDQFHLVLQVVLEILYLPDQLAQMLITARTLPDILRVLLLTLDRSRAGANQVEHPLVRREFWELLYEDGVVRQEGLDLGVSWWEVTGSTDQLPDLTDGETMRNVVLQVRQGVYYLLVQHYKSFLSHQFARMVAVALRPMNAVRDGEVRELAFWLSMPNAEVTLAWATSQQQFGQFANADRSLWEAREDC